MKNNFLDVSVPGNINEVSAILQKSGFSEYGSFNEGEFQHDTYTCTKGKFDGDVVDVYWNWHSGKVIRVEVSSQFKANKPLFKFQTKLNVQE